MDDNSKPAVTNGAAAATAPQELDGAGTTVRGRASALLQTVRAKVQRFGGPFLVNFLVILSVAVLTLALLSLSFVRFVQDRRVQMVADAFSASLAAVAASVRALPPEMRDAHLDALGRLTNGRLVADDPANWGFTEPRTDMIERYFLSMREQLPNYNVAFTAGTPPFLWLGLPLGEGRTRWIRHDLSGFVDIPLPYLILVALATTAVASAGAAFLLVRMRRQLGWLVDAMDGIDARGGGPAPMPPSGHDGDVLELDRHFKKMAARLADAHAERAVMMTGVSQDLRRLLDGLRAALPRATTPVEALRYAGEMDRVLEQFAAFAQASDLEPKLPLDINPLLGELALQHAGAGVTFEVNLGGLPYTDLRLAAARRIFGNLVDNAVRHGGGRVELSSALENGWVVVRVLDAGPGVSDAELALLGRPFYRTDAGRARGAGSGLGLAIARQEVEAHGGSLRLAKRLGGGLQVEVWLPPAKLA
ncbi:ATP-binding protein [Ramlibacter sp. AN1015]|uniref:ATP-binding protein n=1 Tax=Ramlibacter sp. AN1015 TaxID=3133428 RepID=UPI0030BB27F8